MKTITFKFASAAMVVLAVAGCSGGGERPSAAMTAVAATDDFEKGAQATQELIIGTQGERGQAVYKQYFNDIHANAKKYADTIMFDHENQLWPDLPQLPDGKALMYSGLRLRAMSEAYITPGPLYLNAELLQKIRLGLEAYITRYYHEGVSINGWYEYQIAAPQELMMIINNLDSYLSADLKQRIIAATRAYLSSIEVNQTVLQTSQTSANRVDLAWAMLLRGFVTKNADDIAAAKRAFFVASPDRFASIKNALAYASSAFGYSSVDGFRGDGSYVFHGDIPYSNGYGADLINRAPEILLMVNGTSFDFTQAQKDAILNDAFTQLNNTWLPWMRDGVGMDANAGRAIFRGFEQDHGKGHWGLEGVLKFYRLADLSSNAEVNKQRKLMVGKFVKAFITNEQSYYAKYGGNDDAVAAHDYRKFSLRASSIKIASDIMADGAIPYVKEPLTGTYVNAESDRFLHRTPTFAFAVAGHSYRTGNFEIVAGEGARACYSADGMTYLHDDDLDQYMDYWVAFDANRPAGVTNDASAPVDQGTCSWSANANQRVRKGNLRWSGGVAAGAANLGAFGMDYKDWHWTTAAGSTARVESPFVEAKKSWFAFGDVILALGSDIKCNTGCDRSKLATTIDNRKLNGSGSNVVLVNGNAWQGQTTVADVRTIHISGNADTSTLGLVLPSPRSVSFVKESLAGDWLTLAERGSFLMKGTKVQGHFLQTGLSHMAADSTSYAYIMLPGKNASETTAYAANQTVKVMANTTTVHAAYDQNTGAFAMNVFAAPGTSYVTTSGNLMLNRFTAAGNVNSPLSASEASQLLTAAASETFYGVDGQVKTTGGTSLMSKFVGDELTVWVSQPSRNVRSSILDFSATGYKVANIIEGAEHVSLNDDGSKAVVRIDMDYIGQRTLAFAWDGSGLTYKLRFKIKR